MVSALVFIAHGTEEMEFTIVYDTLVRAGIHCKSVFVPSPGISYASETLVAATCSRGVKIVADTTLSALNSSAADTAVDLLVVPGGAKGAETISQNVEVQKMIKKQVEDDRFVGMICAGSLAAKTSGLGKGQKLALTSHPSVKAELESEFDYQEEPVVTSGKVITSRGPGTAFPFSLALVEQLLGLQKRAEVQGPMVFPSGAI